MKTGASDTAAGCAGAPASVCALEHPCTGSDFAFGGNRLHLCVGGEGSPLLLIHGFPTSGHDWQAVWPALAKRHRLLALDMLGFGLSDKPGRFDYSVSASADQWQALVQSLGLREVDVLAHDYGNTVAQELLARQREDRLSFRIRSVMFLNGGIFPEATHPLLLQKLLLGPIGPLVARLATYRSFAGSMRRICSRPLEAGLLREQWRRILHNDGRRVMPLLVRYIRERRAHRDRWVGALQHAGVPLCLVDGVDDPISGASIVRRWRDLLPDSPVVELKGVGHYPQLEDPMRVLEAAEGFLAGAAARAR